RETMKGSQAISAPFPESLCDFINGFAELRKIKRLLDVVIVDRSEKFEGFSQMPAAGHEEDPVTEFDIELSDGVVELWSGHSWHRDVAQNDVEFEAILQPR